MDEPYNFTAMSEDKGIKPLTGDEAFNEAWKAFAMLSEDIQPSGSNKLEISMDVWSRAVGAMANALAGRKKTEQLFTP